MPSPNAFLLVVIAMAFGIVVFSALLLFSRKTQGRDPNVYLGSLWANKNR